MEREIKFRGRTKDGEWKYGNLVQFNGMCSIVSNKTVEETPLDYVGAAIVKGVVDKDTVGEYTGFKDKDGKEIYEGDILLDSTYDNTCLVVYKGNGWKNEYPHICYVMDKSSVEYLCRVIGNIYDNPELIEEHE